VRENKNIIENSKRRPKKINDYFGSSEYKTCQNENKDPMTDVLIGVTFLIT